MKKKEEKTPLPFLLFKNCCAWNKYYANPDMLHSDTAPHASQVAIEQIIHRNGLRMFCEVIVNPLTTKVLSSRLIRVCTYQRVSKLSEHYDELTAIYSIFQRQRLPVKHEGKQFHFHQTIHE